MKNVIYILCLFFLVFGCSKSDDDGGSGTENPDNIGNEGTQGGVQLYFPQENMLCNLGRDATPTESTVSFEWEANGADNYKITVENLFTGNVIQMETTSDIIPITIPRATPFKWYVEAIFGSKTEQSDTWQFYNAGPGEQSYVPFPAEIIAPLMATSINASTTSVTLKWSGSDVDDDIVGYDVYFGTGESPGLSSPNITTTEVTVSVASGNIYYWRIVTKDALGNTSDSGIFQFKIL